MGKWDKTKKYELVDIDGNVYPARILADDVAGPYPLVAVYRDGDREHVYQADADGRAPAPYDHEFLREAVEPVCHTFWVNVYENYFSVYAQRKFADEYAGRGRIGCVKVDIKCVPGQGISDESA